VKLTLGGIAPEERDFVHAVYRRLRCSRLRASRGDLRAGRLGVTGVSEPLDRLLDRTSERPERPLPRGDLHNLGAKTPPQSDFQLLRADVRLVFDLVPPDPAAVTNTPPVEHGGTFGGWAGLG
jgi:hypothetical protein